MSSPNAQYRYSDQLHESHQRARAARQLRRRSTPPEGILWSWLRNRRRGGFKFRRQFPVGPFVLDFFCEEITLAVEVDSAWHEGRGEQDRSRDAWLAERGIRVLRVTASELAKDEDSVLRRILRVADERKEAKTEKEKSHTEKQ